MAEQKRNPVILIPVALLFSAIFPVVLKFLLNSDFSLGTILVLVLGKTLLSLMAFFSRGRLQRILTIVSAAYSVIFAILLTIGIIITPASAYEQLFIFLRTRQIISARVSIIFILFTGFFSATFAGMLLSHDFVWPFAGMLLVISVMAVLMFMSLPFILLTAGAIFFCIGYLAFRYLDKGYRTRSIIFSLLIILLCGTGGYFLYNLIKPQGNQAIDEFSNRMRSVVSRVIPRFNLMMELPEYGFTLDDENTYSLGAAPLLSPAALFEIEAVSGGYPLYLRNRMFDYFDNNSWRNTAVSGAAESTDTIDPDSTADTADKAEETDLTATEDVTDIFFTRKEKSLHEGELKLTLKLEYYNYLPHTLQTSGFGFTGQMPVIESGNLNSGYYLNQKNPLLMGTSYILGQKAATQLLASADLIPYRQLPFIVPDRIKELAASLVATGDPYTTVKQIKEYLADNYTYNLDTRAPKAGKDFLDFFLFESRNGYSVHFTTALVILARLNGLAARYVSGFYTRLPEAQTASSDGTAGVRTYLFGFSAHAWAEVYFPDSGWSVVEATPILDPVYYTAMAQGLYYARGIELNQLTCRQVKALLGEDVFTGTAGESKPEGWRIPIYFYLIPVGLGLLLLLVYSQYGRLLYLLRRDKKTLLYFSRKIVKQQLKNGIPAPGATGWLKWAETFKKRLPQAKTMIDNYTASIILIAYGGGIAEKQVVADVYRFYLKAGRKRLKAVTD